MRFGAGTTLQIEPGYFGLYVAFATEFATRLIGVATRNFGYAAASPIMVESDDNFFVGAAGGRLSIEAHGLLPFAFALESVAGLFKVERILGV